MPDTSWEEKRDDLCTATLSDFNNAMDRFFTKVDAERKKLNMSDFDVFHALEHGYGDVIAAEWQGWISG